MFNSRSNAFALVASLLILAFNVGCKQNSVLGTGKDLVFAHSTEHAGFMALVDLETYRLTLSDDELDRLPEEFVKLMNVETALGWGCPEGDFRVRITLAPFKPGAGDPDRVTSGYLRTKGRVCLTSMDHISYCAHIQGAKLPRLENSRFSDRVFSLPVGRYKITAKQEFTWTIGEQFAEPLNTEKSYTIHIEPADETEKNEFKAIPWLKPWRK